jgi:hypothetical protein
VTSSEELHIVRSQLESLAMLRMGGAFDEDAERAYSELCDRECSLLGTRAAEHSAADQ